MVALGSDPSASGEAALKPPPPIQRSGRIPIGIKLRAQNLYLNKGYTPKQVGDATGLTAEQVSSLAARGGWAKIRNNRMAAIAQRVETRTGANLGAVEQAIADEADEHTLTALDRTGQALASDSPYASKDAQAFSATVRNLVTVSRAIRNATADVAAGGATQVNLFFFRPSASDTQGKAEKVAEAAQAAIDVPTAQIGEQPEQPQSQ